MGFRVEIMKKDASVSGFNIGVNNGDAARQTIGHAHVHLIPRRKGDVLDPRGGVRGVIPTKGPLLTQATPITMGLSQKGKLYAARRFKGKLIRRCHYGRSRHYALARLEGVLGSIAMLMCRYTTPSPIRSSVPTNSAAMILAIFTARTAISNPLHSKPLLRGIRCAKERHPYRIAISNHDQRMLSEALR
jgi:hypothetical protein